MQALRTLAARKTLKTENKKNIGFKMSLITDQIHTS